MAVLHAVEGPLRGQRFPIPEKPKLIVGRYEVYDLIVPDPSISRKHFAFERRSDGLYLIDLGSLNGTQLNGLRVSTAKLEHGDRITAGQTVLVFDEADQGNAPEVIEEVDVISDDDVLEDGPISLDLPDEIEPAPMEYEVEEVDLDLEPAPEPEPEPAPRASRRSSTRSSGRKSGRKSGRRSRDDSGELGRRVTERLTTPKAGRKSGKTKAGGGGSEECAACGREVTDDELAAGEGAKTRMGYVCGRCVEKRQKSGLKGSLEKFIRQQQKRR